MENSTLVALSRQMSLYRELQVVANNMANAATPAFKGENMLFAEYVARTDDRQKLSFVQDLAVVRDTSEGPMRQTGGTFDFAIHGDGYFAVNTPLGTRYTRSGRFQLDAQNQLVTSAGYAVQSDAGAPLVIPANQGEITISRDGTVSTEAGPIGRIGITQFDNEQALRKVAGGLYSAPLNANPLPAVGAEIVQGMIEDSNVQPILELTRMMDLSRSFASSQRLIEAEHERQRRAISSIVTAQS